MQSRDFTVKGSTILSKLVYAREHFGPEAEKDLAAFLSEAGEKQVLDGSWYPFALYEGVLKRLAERHFGGDLVRLRELGEDSARRALTETYQVYGQMGLTHFLSRIGALHKRFYSHGEIEATMDDDGSRCTIRMFEVPVHSKVDRQVAAGFYVGACRVMGLRDVRCRVATVGDETFFYIDWTTGPVDREEESLVSSQP
jgi:hypothetical protein